MNIEQAVKFLKASKEMMKSTQGEVDTIKRINPNKKVAEQEHFNTINTMLNEQMEKVGAPIDNGVAVQPSDSVQQKKAFIKNEQTYNTEQKPKKKFLGEHSVGVAVEDESLATKLELPKREIPEAEQKLIEEFEKQKDIKVKPTYNEVLVPKDGRRFDSIKLPSNGEPYAHKKTHLGVYYLTARDEALILEPNLYSQGLLIDALFKNRFVDEEIDGDDLIKADRDYISLWLRSTGYGDSITITVKNPHDDSFFETNFLLSSIKPKPFTLKSDENGEFDYTLNNGDEIKFSFPTRREEREFEKGLLEAEKSVQRERLDEITRDLDILHGLGIPELSNSDLDTIDTIINSLDLIKQKINTKLSHNFYSRGILGLQILTIKSINGNRDRDFIKNYIENAQLSDIKDYRRYFDKNCPGLDMSISVTIPEGHKGEGEIVNTAIALDQTVFLSDLD